MISLFKVNRKHSETGSTDIGIFLGQKTGFI